MQGGSKSLVENATQFEISLKELKNFSSQLYHAAEYCETAFLNAKDKKIVVKNTKEYVSCAVVTFVDHLGSISASLEYCISETDSVPQTEHKIDSLKQRIGACQQYSNKIALHRFYRASEFSRYHCRYISPPLSDLAEMNHVASIVKNGKENQFETEEPLFLYTRTIEKKNGFSPPVLPVRDGLSILPKAGLSSFQFQEAQKLKRNTLNWKLMQNKEITSLIRRGKRILT